MTSTNQIFDIRRFWKYVCYDLRINNKEYLKALGVTILFFLFLFATPFLFLSNLIAFEYNDIAVYSVGYVCIVAIATRERFSKETIKKNGLEYLISVPASNIEKFLNAALIRVLIGLLIGIIFGLLSVAIYTIALTNDFSIGLYVREIKNVFSLNHIQELHVNNNRLILFFIYAIPYNMSYILRNKVRSELKRIYAVFYYLYPLVAGFMIFMPDFFPSIKATLSFYLLPIIIFNSLALIYFYFVLKNTSYNEKTSDNAKKFYF